MSRVLITGGAGGLGQALAPLLTNGHSIVRISSRGLRRGDGDENWEWAQSGLEPGAALNAAVRDVETIVHCASSPFRQTKQVDVTGTQNLLQAAQSAGVKHFVYISIVGVDRIPFGYYRAKYTAEEAVEQGGVPWSILRATQFHTLLADNFIPALFRLPVALIPTNFKFQLLDTGEAAQRLAEIVASGPMGRAPDIGGPEVRTFGDLASAWQSASGYRKRVVKLPLIGGAARAFRDGWNTTPENPFGKITWEEWLARKYAA